MTPAGNKGSSDDYRIRITISIRENGMPQRYLCSQSARAGGGGGSSMTLDRCDSDCETNDKPKFED